MFRSPNDMRRSRFLIALTALALARGAAAQLNQDCIVSVLNRNTQVDASGNWTLPNIPAGFGLVRARATCVRGGVTSSGESGLFTVVANRTSAVPQIVLGNTSPVPTSLTITSPSTTLSSVGATTQLTARATYVSAATADVTASSTGTSYTVSNSAIATVSGDGLVTAVSTGTVVIQAVNEGRSAIVSISVLLSGADSDGDGIPDDWEIAHGLNPHDPSDALLDIDHDGLTNLQEYRLGTDIRIADTDGDGISDGDEVNGTGLACSTAGRCYRTNPLLADTDGDGITDRTEILTGTDPTDPTNVNLHAALTGITVTPSNFTLIVNSLSGSASAQLTVTGQLIDGRTIDLTATSRGTNYLSSDLGVCTFGSPDGRVYAGSAGSCRITVSSNGYVANVSGAVSNFTPADLSYVSVPGFANAVAVAGDYAYIAAGGSGLQIVGLSSDRTHPTVISSLNLSGSTYDVTLVGNTAYLAGSSTLSVVDITNPLVPVLRGTFSTSGSCLGIAVSGQNAYLNCTNGLQVVNISNPASMIQVSSLNVGGTPWKIAVDAARHYVAMAEGSAGLKFVDITNPAAPTLLGTALTGDARAATLNGTFAYVADYSTSTNAVDTTNLRAPVILSHVMPYTVGGYLQDIVTSGAFALAADVVFVNGIPITDISTPSQLQARTILNLSQRDDNGMGIAVDSSFVYLVTEHSTLQRGGSSGDSRLYIGQYLPRQDLGGVPPTASITSPVNNSTVYQGAQLTVSVNAIDDVAVASVDFKVNGQTVYTTTSTPYQYTFTVPTGVTTLTLGAAARDLGGNVGNASDVTVSVQPDPLTLVSGRIIDQNGAPVSGASVTVNGGLSGVTNASGSFAIPSVPTVLGNIQANATATINGTNLNGASLLTPPVLGGETNVGTIHLIPASFITNYGTLVSRCDDCYYPYTLPFSFPYYGTTVTSTYVGTNGYLTFGSGDSTYTENLPAFNNLPRIAAFFDDLYAGQSADATSGLYVNSSIPNLFLVTYLKNPHYGTSTPFNTLQIQLYSDGRIIFAYNGIGSLNTGTIVGLTPGPNSPAQAVDYVTQTNVNIPAGTSVYEYFNATQLFNLDQTFVVFTPISGGGYNVRTIRASGTSQSGVVTGSTSATPALHTVTTRSSGAGSSTTAQAGTLSTAQIAGAEVIVRSSVNPNYIGMVNADSRGNFVLTGVPVGGIFVQVKKNGTVLAEGGGNFTGDALTSAQALSIVVKAPVPSNKTQPQVTQ